MGRAYAAILGCLAFTTLLARGLIQGSDAEPTIQLACGALCGFAILGYGIGQAAAWVVTDSVQARLAAELKAGRSAANKQSDTSS